VGVPVLTTIAGCNGSGKSSFSNAVTSNDTPSFDYDKVFLEVYNALESSDFQDEMAHNISRKKLIDSIDNAIANNAWTRFFTPKRTLMIFLIVCLTIEMAQYFKLYDGVFDIWDLLAYVSILFPLFLIDLRLIRQSEKSS